MTMNQISPAKVLSEVAAAVPASCRGNMAINVLRQRKWRSERHPKLDLNFGL